MDEIEKIIEILRESRELLRQFRVSSLSIFGSVARGDAAKNSDIDILV
ncbi:MAG: nucleotidyltransferase domain-containing protein, partial [Candidatus Sabulitectum sp.]|nr:nucleotidyltransferase domain-containing protein [Candidatus Sabulitectum sp.]